MAGKRIPFAVWKVGDEEYKLKLTTTSIVRLEDELKVNLISVLNMGIPPLGVMLKIAHEAIKKYHHGIKYKDVEDMFDTYLDEGGSQTEFLTDVIMKVYQASGFFTEGMEETMEEKIEEAKEEMDT